MSPYNQWVTVAEYQYDGRGRRIVKKTYAGRSLTETRHFYWSSNWQDLEERVGNETTPNFQQVWGIRYVDELVCWNYFVFAGSSSSGPLAYDLRLCWQMKLTRHEVLNWI